MQLFKTEMIFLSSSPPAARPCYGSSRYGSCGPLLQRTLAVQPVRSASICILNPMDPEPCACRRRNAAWLPACEMDRAA